MDISIFRIAAIIILVNVSCGLPQNQESSINETNLEEGGVLDISGEADDDGVMSRTWEHTKEWSLSEEIRYGEWIKKNYKTDFLIKRKITADCADAEMLRRAWYAMKRGLPMAYRPIYDTSTIVTSLDYEDNPKQFMHDMQNAVSTHNLPLNSFRVRVGPSGSEGASDAIRPGIFFLFHKHHTMPVADINDELGLLVIRASTIAPTPIPLFEHFLFESKVDDQTTSFRRQYSPVFDSNRQVSLKIMNRNWEQVGPYQDPNVDISKIPFFEWIQKLLLNLDDEGMKQIREKTAGLLLEAVKKDIENRIKVVDEGYQACWNYTGTDPNLCSPGPEGVHSTPGRDERLKMTFSNAFNYQSILGQTGQVELAEKMAKFLNESTFEFRVVLDHKEEKVEFKKTMPYNVFIGKMFNGKLSSNPRDSIQERWGEIIRNVSGDSPEKYFNDLSLIFVEGESVLQNLQWRLSLTYNLKDQCKSNANSEECKKALEELKNNDVIISKKFHEYLEKPVTIPGTITYEFMYKKTWVYITVENKPVNNINAEEAKKMMFDAYYTVVDPSLIQGSLERFDPKNAINASQFLEVYNHGKIKYKTDASWKELWGQE